jgi:hypothetical protein
MEGAITNVSATSVVIQSDTFSGSGSFSNWVLTRADGGATGFFLDGLDGSITASTGNIAGFSLSKTGFLSLGEFANTFILPFGDGVVQQRRIDFNGTIRSMGTQYNVDNIINEQLSFDFTGPGLPREFKINGVVVGGGTSSISVKENITDLDLEEEINILLENLSFKKYNYKYGLFSNDQDIGFIIEDIKSLNIPIIQNAILYEPRKLIVNETTNRFYLS